MTETYKMPEQDHEDSILVARMMARLTLQGFEPEPRYRIRVVPDWMKPDFPEEENERTAQQS